MQIKPSEADRFLATPDRAVRLVLIYGNDDGLVAERARLFAKAVNDGSDDPFGHLRLDPAELAADPRRLADEAHAIPLFGGRRCISIRQAGNWSILPALEPLLAAPPEDSWIVVIAGELKKTSAIRRFFENARTTAAAIACYADSGRDLDSLIDQETKAANVRIAPDARAALRNLIGSDRLSSRSEIGKLCLYAGEGGTISVDDVAAVVGDAAAFAVDELIDAAALGDAASFARAYRRLIAAGSADFVIAGAALRHFDALHRARALFDQGADAESVVGPQIYFKRKPAVARQVASWPISAIERAMAILDRAIVDSRLHGPISEEIVGQALISIAAIAAAANR